MFACDCLRHQKWEYSTLEFFCYGFAVNGFYWDIFPVWFILRNYQLCPWALGIPHRLEFLLASCIWDNVSCLDWKTIRVVVSNMPRRVDGSVVEYGSVQLWMF